MQTHTSTYPSAPASLPRAVMPPERGTAVIPGALKPSHQLRFESLYNPGRGVAFPCDERGEVDLSTLTERMRNAYLGARHLIGREYLCPSIERIV